jgi:predicted nucleotidyltransferase
MPIAIETMAAETDPTPTADETTIAGGTFPHLTLAQPGALESIPPDERAGAAATEPSTAEPDELPAPPRIFRSGAIPEMDDRSTVVGAVDRAARADSLGLEAGARVAEQLRSIYEERLRGIYLFGARTSFGAPADAEVELLVVLDRIESYGAELERTSAICAGLSLQLGVIVSRLFVSEADWRDRQDGRLPAVRGEAVPL